MLRIFFSFLFTVLSIANAYAAAPKGSTKNYDIGYQVGDRNDVRIQPYSTLKLKGKFQVWYLLGEPVINCTAAWQNPGITQVVLDDGTRILAEPGEEEIWNLKLMAQFPNPDKNARRLTNGGGAHLSVFCDAGVVAQNGRGGFNVGESPSWDKFVCATPSKVDASYLFDIDRKQKDLCASVRGEWLPSADAKKVAIAGIALDEIMVHGFEINNGDTRRRAEKLLWRRQSFANKEGKANAVLNRMRNFGQEGGLAANDLAQHRYSVSQNGQRATAADLKAMDEFIERALARLEALNTGARSDMTASWVEPDQQLVKKQLEHIATVDRALRERDKILADYRAELERLAKNAPQQPENPLQKYIVNEHSLVPYSERYSSDHGLKSQSGQIIVKPDEGQYTPLVGESGTKYDIYLGTHRWVTKWIRDKNGKKLGLDFYRGYSRFHEDPGVITFAIGDDHSSHAFLSVYSFVEDRVVFDSKQTPIAGRYRNTERIVTVNEGRSSDWSRDYGMKVRSEKLEGRMVIYGITRGLHPYKMKNECTSKTEKGDVGGVKPGFMYDVEANRLLPVPEHLCVPNPTADW